VQIDLFTFLAQIVNFLALVALLRYFLYRRIVKAMDERKRRISERMDEAESKKKEAEEKAASYEEKQKQLQKEKENVLQRARDEAEAKRKELVKEARQDVEHDRKKWEEGMYRQRGSFMDELRNRAGEQVCSISRKVLRELADEELESHAVKIFLKRLGSLSDSEKNDLLENGRESKKMVLRSAFDLPKKLKSEVEDALADIDLEKTGLDFKKAEDLICGIELEFGGRKIAWSIDSYLELLEQRISGAFESFQSGESLEEKQKKDKGRAKKEADSKKKTTGEEKKQKGENENGDEENERQKENETKKEQEREKDSGQKKQEGKDSGR
jgi:F-type H+-transporting ATPase subunit b